VTDPQHGFEKPPGEVPNPVSKVERQPRMSMVPIATGVSGR
jgi:hypothetical protein